MLNFLYSAYKLFQTKWENPVIGALRKKLLEHFTAIFGISNDKNKEEK